MGERTRSRAVALLLSVALVSPGLIVPGSALAQGACPPEPPYGVPAFVIEFASNEQVTMNYGVATVVAPLSGEEPNLHQYLSGDTAVSGGGCGNPLDPILITRRDGSRGEVDASEQAAAGVGTYSDCGTDEWAGMRQEYEVPDRPWTYTIVVEGTGPCEGAYTDEQKSIGEPFARTQPEQANVKVKVSYYPALSTVPTDLWDVSATVGVLNAKSLENARYDVGSYERPPPVALATLTLPPIGSDGVGQVTALASGDPVENTSDGSTEEVELPGLDPRLVGNPNLGGPLASYWDSLDGATAEERRLRAILMLAVLVRGGPGLFLRWVLTGDFEFAEEALKPVGPEDSTDAVDPPTKSPPLMSRKAHEQGRRWVWLPAEASVRRKGATLYLKPGTWYQTIIKKDGIRTFWNKKGKLIGRTGDKVQVTAWGKEAVPSDDLSTLWKDAMTGSLLQTPPDPPSAKQPLSSGSAYVYFTRPTHVQDGLPYPDGTYERRVLMPRRWYRADIEPDNDYEWNIWTIGGQWRGELHDKSNLRFAPNTPLPVEYPTE